MPSRLNSKRIVPLKKIFKFSINNNTSRSFSFELSSCDKINTTIALSAMGNKSISSPIKENNDDDQDSSLIYHVDLQLHLLCDDAFNLSKYIINNPFDNVGIRLMQHMDVSVINDNLILTGLMFDDVIFQKTEFVVPIIGLDDEFLILKNSCVFFSSNYCQHEIFNSLLQEEDPVIYSYQLVVYKDFVKVSCVTNKKNVFQLDAWKLFGFVLPFMIWRRLFNHLFKIDTMIVTVKGLENTAFVDNDLYSYKFVLYIRKYYHYLI